MNVDTGQAQQPTVAASPFTTAIYAGPLGNFTAHPFYQSLGNVSIAVRSSKRGPVPHHKDAVDNLPACWQSLEIRSPQPHRASCSPVLTACVRVRCIELPQGVDRAWDAWHVEGTLCRIDFVGCCLSKDMTPPCSL